MTSETLPRYYVYILYSQKDKGLYIGFTIDLRSRLRRHNSGSVSSTKERAPFKLIHYEYFLCEEDAKSREVFLKSGYGRRHLKALLTRTLTLSDECLHRLQE
ncbi:MAG: GIY-YIG nuclease family protein [bacterium]|nr:GIY-YIG nuclease family protein [bacterium]